MADQLRTEQSHTLNRVAEMCSGVIGHMSLQPTQSRAAGEPQLRPGVDMPTYTGYDGPKSVDNFSNELHNILQSYWCLGSVHDCSSPSTGFTGCRRMMRKFLPTGNGLPVQRELEVRTELPDESLLKCVPRSPTASARDKIFRVIRQSRPKFRPFLYGRTYETIENLAREARGVQDDLAAESTYVPPPAAQSALELSLTRRAPVSSPSCDMTSPGIVAANSSRALDPFAFQQGRRRSPCDTVSGERYRCEQVSAEHTPSKRRALGPYSSQPRAQTFGPLHPICRVFNKSCASRLRQALPQWVLRGCLRRKAWFHGTLSTFTRGGTNVQRSKERFRPATLKSASVSKGATANARSEECYLACATEEKQADEGFPLDFPARGYHLPGQSESTPFAVATDPGHLKQRGKTWKPCTQP
ncbi:hypothetical protein HPB50_007724 [Hyalomma asiaticum]|uniref:Uncharacterized protein n=1 Tax=Hyalomma asiaticum TaxID=266040 RepID=A0ACB7S487_HYAAI|nr:hypothetical protein HPB50_007724 [Hyalomma asiaticum]